MSMDAKQVKEAAAFLNGEPTVDEAEIVSWEAAPEGEVLHLWQNTFKSYGAGLLRDQVIERGGGIYFLTKEEAQGSSDGEPLRHLAARIGKQFYLLDRPVFPRGVK